MTFDCRFVEDNYDSKEEAKRAMDVYCYRLARPSVPTPPPWTVVWMPWSSPAASARTPPPIREITLNKLGLLGFDVDHDANLKARFGRTADHQGWFHPRPGYPDQRRVGHRPRRAGTGRRINC